MAFYNNIDDKFHSINFELNNNNVKIALANAIRRILLSELSMFAFDVDSLKIYTNTSMLHNGFITQRLPLIPLKQENLKNYNINDITVSLNKTNTENHMIDITGHDFTIEYQNRSLNPDDIFITSDFLFYKLKPQQEIHFSVNISYDNSSSKSAAFSNVSKSVYYYKRDEKLLNEVTKNLSDDDKKNFLLAEADKYYIKNNKGEPGVYIFSIESVTDISCKELFLKSLDLIIDKLNHLHSSIEDTTISEGKIIMKKSETSMEAFDFILKDETHTIGNLLASYLVDRNNIKYAAYNMPHPAFKEIVIRMALENDNTPENNIKVFKDNIDDVKKIVSDMKDQWNNYSNKKTTTKKIKIKTKNKVKEI